MVEHLLDDVGRDGHGVVPGAEGTPQVMRAPAASIVGKPMLHVVAGRLPRVSFELGERQPRKPNPVLALVLRELRWDYPILALSVAVVGLADPETRRQ